MITHTKVFHMKKDPMGKSQDVLLTTQLLLANVKGLNSKKFFQVNEK